MAETTTKNFFIKMIVKFYDNCPLNSFSYPMVKIKDSDFEKVKKALNKYRKENEDSYNWDNFIILLKEKKLLIDETTPDEELYF